MGGALLQPAGAIAPGPEGAVLVDDAAEVGGEGGAVGLGDFARGGAVAAEDGFSGRVERDAEGVLEFVVRERVEVRREGGELILV